MEIDFSIIRDCAFMFITFPEWIELEHRTVSFKEFDYRELQHTRIVCTNLALGVIRNQFG